MKRRRVIDDKKQLLREERKRNRLYHEKWSVLPSWMRRGIALPSTSNTVPMEALVKRPELLVALNGLGATHAFPVQQAMFRLLMANSDSDSGRGGGEAACEQGDVAVMSPTGTGKTLAFAVPIVDHLALRIIDSLGALVVLPTRDLALQVYNVFRALAEPEGLTVCTVTADTSFHKQVDAVARANIVVCTPGRLMDHLETIDLSSLRFLVIDEADRLLSKQFGDWLPQLLGALPDQQRATEAPVYQSLLPCSPRLVKMVFSATMTANPRKMASLRLTRPRFFYALSAEPSAAALKLPSTLVERLISIRSENDRPLALCWAISDFVARSSADAGGVLIFVSSAERANRLIQLLQGTLGTKFISSAMLHGNMRGRQRESTLSEFRKGSTRVLIATDVLSRGLDIGNVGLVINYDVHGIRKPRNYLHRVGRTARAGRRGEAVTLVTWDQVGTWKKMRSSIVHTKNTSSVEGTAAEKVPKQWMREHRPAFEKALAQLSKRVKRHVDIYEQQTEAELDQRMKLAVTSETRGEALRLLEAQSNV